MYDHNQSPSPTFFKLGADEIVMVLDANTIKVPVSDDALNAFFNEDWSWFLEHSIQDEAVKVA